MPKRRLLSFFLELPPLLGVDVAAAVLAPLVADGVARDALLPLASGGADAPAPPVSTPPAAAAERST